MRDTDAAQPDNAKTTDVPTSVGGRVGTFRYFRLEDRWEWSEAVAEMHGYEPGQVNPPTTA